MLCLIFFFFGFIWSELSFFSSKDFYLLFFDMTLQTVPACQNLYKNSFTYHCLKDDKVIQFDEAIQFLGMIMQTSLLFWCACINRRTFLEIHFLNNMLISHKVINMVFNFYLLFFYLKLLN